MTGRPWLPLDRIYARGIRTPTGCLLWPGARAGRDRAYGYVGANGRQVRVHRLSWELANGRPIAPGMTIDHLCGVPLCYEPAHLEEVTLRENLLRGDTFQARNAGKTECPAGHPYDEQNTHYRPDGSRSCRACGRDYMRRRRATR